MKLQSMFQDIDRFRLALSEGADPNELDQFGNTPLHNAPTVELVKLLISYGSDPTIKNLVGDTPLDNNREKFELEVSDAFKEKTRQIMTLLENPHVGVVELIEDAHDEIDNLKMLIETLKKRIQNLISENTTLHVELNKNKSVKDQVWECKNPFNRLSTSVEERLDSCEPDKKSLETNGINRFGKRSDCMKSCTK